MINMRRIPSITALQCFEASARLRSFTRAGEELHLTQGAVSRQVIRLEEELGIALFVRKQSALALGLTEAGGTYLRDVVPLLAALERSTAAARAHRTEGGVLNLSVGASLGSYWLIPRLSSFTRAHPEIVINVATRVGPADFGREGIDASLEFGSGERPGMTCDFILSLDLQPFASKDWIERFGEQLTANTPSTALIHHSTGPEAWAEWFRYANINNSAGRGGPIYDLMWMAMNAAANGLGAVLLPKYMSESAVSSRRLQSLSSICWPCPKSYYLVYPHTKGSQRTLRKFRSWLLSQVNQSDS